MCVLYILIHVKIPFTLFKQIAKVINKEKILTIYTRFKFSYIFRGCPRGTQLINNESMTFHTSIITIHNFIAPSLVVKHNFFVHTVAIDLSYWRYET